jgi:hypothetical protein
MGEDNEAEEIVGQRVNRFVRRTMKRMLKLALLLPPQKGADFFAAADIRLADVVEVELWLKDVSLIMTKHAMQRTCEECGGGIGYSPVAGNGHVTLQISRWRPDARYCSAKCRQSAYRKCVTERKRREHQAVTNVASPCTGEHLAVTEPQ